MSLSDKPKIIFSDVDGTVVHYLATLTEQQGYKVIDDDDASKQNKDDEHEHITLMHTPTSTTIPCIRVPSATLVGGVVSLRTLQLVDELRERHGVKFVLMTGARSSTYLKRKATGTVPTTDYDVFEGGGRLQVGGDDIEEWYNSHIGVTGPREQMGIDDPTQRTNGTLWDAYRDLLHHATVTYKLDARDFSTAFMASWKHLPEGGGGERALMQWAAERGGPLFGVDVVTNLNKGHVIPKKCGKADAARYILSREGLRESDAVAMFDDDNDIALAEEVCLGGAYCIGVAHANVARALERNRGRWVRPPHGGPLATEYALECVLKRLSDAH